MQKNHTRLVLLATATVFAVAGVFGSAAFPTYWHSFVQARPQQPAGTTFDLSDISIPKNEIRGGGPPKDGIPAISSPALVDAKDASFLNDNDRIVGITFEGNSRAYPIAILTQHEIVNDVVGQTPVAITYCPLCDSVVVFDRRTPLGEKEFGVSGLLYNSNVLMYDRSEKESLWSQMLKKGVSGPGKGVKLKVLPMELTSWSAWKSQHPKTDVISTETGHRRDYSRNPYARYFKQSALMFPVKPTNATLPLKEPVLAVWDESESVVIAVSLFKRNKQASYSGSLNGKSFQVERDAKANALRITSADEGLSWLNAYWFAWYAFHPNTKIAKM